MILIYFYYELLFNSFLYKLFISQIYIPRLSIFIYFDWVLNLTEHMLIIYFFQKLQCKILHNFVFFDSGH
jgi:hypothetical protein